MLVSRVCATQQSLLKAAGGSSLASNANANALSAVGGQGLMMLG
jgi:hypothetical protein